MLVVSRQGSLRILWLLLVVCLCSCFTGSHSGSASRFPNLPIRQSDRSVVHDLLFRLPSVVLRRVSNPLTVITDFALGPALCLDFEDMIKSQTCNFLPTTKVFPVCIQSLGIDLLDEVLRFSRLWDVVVCPLDENLDGAFQAVHSVPNQGVDFIGHDVCVGE